MREYYLSGTSLSFCFSISHLLILIRVSEFPCNSAAFMRVSNLDAQLPTLTQAGPQGSRKVDNTRSSSSRSYGNDWAYLKEGRMERQKESKHHTQQLDKKKTLLFFSFCLSRISFLAIFRVIHFLFLSTTLSEPYFFGTTNKGSSPSFSSACALACLPASQ